MAKYVKKMMVVLALLTVAIFTVGTNAQFSGCTINFTGIQGCLPAAIDPKAKASTSCCSIMKTVDLSCMCLFKSSLPLKGFDILFALTVATKCYMQTPAVCF